MRGGLHGMRTELLNSDSLIQEEAPERRLRVFITFEEQTRC